tara:strand:+ start:173 stop:499 length:327 start_codon:yes stop_codon:yes gene_type:complete
MTTQFPRAHQFNQLDDKQQYEFADDMVKLWGSIREQIEVKAIADGKADPREVGKPIDLAPTLGMFKAIAKKHGFCITDVIEYEEKGKLIAAPYIRVGNGRKASKPNWR